jgi:hypothetical protein
MPIDSFTGIQLSKGLLYGYKPEFKFGSNPAVGTTEETIWDQGGLYVYPTAAITMTVSSSSTDDAAAGTGARTVAIAGLDANYREIGETVTLNGQTAVSTIRQYIRVFRARVTSAGSGGTNAGNIHIGAGAVTTGVPATTYARISAAEGQTLMALFTVPAGYTAYIQQGTISTGTEQANQYVTARLKVRPFGEVFQTKALVTLSNEFIPFDFGVALAIPEKSDIEARAISSSTENSVAVTFSLILEDNAKG